MLDDILQHSVTMTVIEKSFQLVTHMGVARGWLKSSSQNDASMKKPPQKLYSFYFIGFICFYLCTLQRSTCIAFGSMFLNNGALLMLQQL